MYLPYIYKLTDKTTGMWYIGSRVSELEQCYPEELGARYFTSSSVIEPLFRETPDRFVKEILVMSDDYEYIIRTEASMLMFRDAKNDPMSYNMHNGDGMMNTKKSGAISGRTVGKMLFEAKTGMFSPELIGKGGKIGGAVTRDKKLGCFARKFAQHSSDSRNAGEFTRDQKLGFHSWTFEQFSEHNKKNGKVLNSQRWCCVVCGRESTLGPLASHQKHSGHSGKTRIN